MTTINNDVASVNILFFFFQNTILPIEKIILNAAWLDLKQLRHWIEFIAQVISITYTTSTTVRNSMEKTATMTTPNSTYHKISCNEHAFGQMLRINARYACYEPYLPQYNWKLESNKVTNHKILNMIPVHGKKRPPLEWQRQKKLEYYSWSLPIAR